MMSYGEFTYILYQYILKITISYQFSGWLPDNKNAEPSDKKNEKCLYLQSAFPHPDKSLGDVEMGYLYWADDVCKRTRKRMKNGFRFLCERPKEEEVIHSTDTVVEGLDNVHGHK